VADQGSGSSWAASNPWSGAPLSAGPTPVHEQPLVVIGDITVSASWVVTPAGTRPLREMSWHVADTSRTTRVIPQWAIVLAVIGFFFFLLGLLFLLVKEDRTDGSVQVAVTGPGFSYSSQIPVHAPAQVADVHQRVAYARSVTAAAQAVR
jgi:hypothetical protein